MEDTDEENYQKLKKVVLEFLDACATGYEELEDGEYEYAIQEPKDDDEGILKLGISLDDDGSHYTMYAYMGPYSMTEERANAFSRKISYMLNRINDYENGTKYFLNQMGEEIRLCTQQGYDTFDGMPTKESLYKRLQDLIGAFSDAVPLIQKAVDGEDADDVMDDLFQELDEAFEKE